jgi:hypothetical protein
MELFWGVLLVMLSAVSFCILLLCERNPKITHLNSDFLVGGILVPLITGMGIVGGLLVIQYVISYSSENFSWTSPSMAAAVVVVGIVVIKSMNIKKRLALYRSHEENAGATIHTLENKSNTGTPAAGHRAA